MTGTRAIVAIGLRNQANRIRRPHHLGWGYGWTLSFAGSQGYAKNSDRREMAVFTAGLRLSIQLRDRPA